MHPDTLASPGMSAATGIANRAIRRVPAYASYLRDRGHSLAAVGPDDFARLPITTKSSYIGQYPLDELIWDGDITIAGTWSSTSGSTGSPTFFPRESRSLDDSAVFYDRIFREGFDVGGHRTLMIVCFAMGTWIGGTYSYQAGIALRHRGNRLSVATPGIDVKAAVAILEQLGSRYDKIVLAGYPPFIKDVIDQSSARALSQDIAVLLAGEAISEEWRDHILERLGVPHEPARVCLMYGTAEAGVMGHETPATTRIRRAARTDSALCVGIFGEHTHRLPTFVEFDPMRRFTEVDDEGNLLFTIDSVLPLIRYRINDRGSVLSGRRLGAILEDSGHGELAGNIEPTSGFIVLTGRPDVAATFYSANLYPCDLKDAFEDPSVSRLLTGKFVVDTDPDEHQDPVLRIRAELAANVGTGDVSLGDRLSTLSLASLVANNEEFRTLYATHGDRTVPQIELHPYGTGDFVPGAKHCYIGAGR